MGNGASNCWQQPMLAWLTILSKANALGPQLKPVPWGGKGRSIGLQFMIIDILRSLHEKRTILPWFVGFLVVVGEIFAWLNRSAGLRRVFYRSLFFGLAVLALGTVVVDNRG